MAEFEQLDADANGVLSREEHNKLHLADFDVRPAEAVFAAKDTDPTDGEISRVEWMDFARRHHGYPEESVHRSSGIAQDIATLSEYQSLRVCLYTYLPACLCHSSCLPACLPACLPLPFLLPACLPACLPERPTTSRCGR